MPITFEVTHACGCRRRYTVSEGNPRMLATLERTLEQKRCGQCPATQRLLARSQIPGMNGHTKGKGP